MKLIVADTGPLITLAAAASLDYLLYAGVGLFIPDAVLYEATVKAGALGADSIVAWIQENGDAVFPIVTETYANFLAARQVNPAHRERDLGERAAVEAMRYAIPLAANERALLLTEADRVLRGTFLVTLDDRERIIAVTTYDFLFGLEAAGRINSVEEVYRLAEDAGRNASRQSVLSAQHSAAREAVDRLLKPKP